jgi:hypothetical protein
MKKKGIQLLPKRRTGDPRASALALVGQLLIITIIVPAFIVPIAYDWLRDDSGRAVVPEVISFEIALPVDGTPNRGETRDGGDNRPVTDEEPTEVPAPPLIPPSGVPSTLPAVPSDPAAPAAVGGGYGDIVGDGGPVRGIRPTFTDQRLWAPPGNVVVAPVVPLNRADTLRLMLQRSIVAYADSLDRYNPDDGRRPGDWTFNLGGKKFGVDQGMIRLGNFSLPTPILGMLALNNVQANPMAMERARRLDAMRSEIQQQSARQMRDDEFDRAVQALRQRREKERREAQQRQQSEKPPATPSTP